MAEEWICYENNKLLCKITQWVENGDQQRQCYIKFDYICTHYGFTGHLHDGFNPRSSHTKDLKNGTWCLLA